MKVVGLMSGTSLDGIDAALVEIGGMAGAGQDRALDWRLLAFDTRPFTADRRDEIHETILRGTAASLARLHARLGEWFAEAVVRVCHKAAVALSDVALVGSHGQTVWHRPPSAVERGATLQLGDPATIAEQTGASVVSDFRSRDVAAGGEGAPLVPRVDQLLFADDRTRILLNIGGMANLTRVPGRDSDAPLVAFDTGPGNAPIDTVVTLATNGARTFDEDGEWARRGRVDRRLLDQLMDDPYFRRPPPKSTGREAFGRTYVETILAQHAPTGPDEWADLARTLSALTARTIGDAIRQWAPVDPTAEVIVTGGGARNPVLMELLAAELDPVPVRSGEVLGIDPEAKEAVAFAVLAWAHVADVAGNLPDVTGAAGPRVLGSFTPGRSAMGGPRAGPAVSP